MNKNKKIISIIFVVIVIILIIAGPTIIKQEMKLREIKKTVISILNGEQVNFDKPNPWGGQYVIEGEKNHIQVNKIPPYAGSRLVSIFQSDNTTAIYAYETKAVYIIKKTRVR